MKYSLCIALLGLSLIHATCLRPVTPPSPVAQCLARFPQHSDWPDTLHCFLPETPVGVPVSDTLLKAALDSAQFASLHYDTGEPRFWAVGQFPFAEGLNAGLLQTEEFWFGKQSLLIFDLQSQKCLAVVELSHFYGGDGGQTASESWLFRSKNPPQLFVKRAEHGYMFPSASPDEPQEYLDESGELFRWEGKQFLAIPNPDSALFLRRYVMDRTW